MALAYIGVVTAIIGDLATGFGYVKCAQVPPSSFGASNCSPTFIFGPLLCSCIVGMSNVVTAITLVAMGTSLPDTFASKSACLADDNADAAIGNVTGRYDHWLLLKYPGHYYRS